MSRTTTFKDGSSSVLTLGINSEFTIEPTFRDYGNVFLYLRTYDDVAALEANEAVASGLTWSVLGRVMLADGAPYWRTLANGSAVGSAVVNDTDRIEPAGFGHSDAVKLVFTGDWSGYFARAVAEFS